MKVLLLSRYGSLGASSRVRYRQYLPYLRSHGVEVSIAPLFSNTYLKALYKGDKSWREVFAGYGRRFFKLLRIRKFDIVIIEKELFPFLPSIAECLLDIIGVRYVVDYDDALFHRYDHHGNALVRFLLGKKIDKVMRHSKVVIAGNEYLAKRARQAGAPLVEIIPTVVDTKRYFPTHKPVNKVPVVGWIGTPKTSRYLLPLLSVFQDLTKEMNVRFVAVGACEEDFEDTPVEVLPWSEETEVATIQLFDIGIMPLDDSHWERGKCGYKLIQYMACGLPVVASPVGVNCEIVIPDKNGFLARTNSEWKTMLRFLLQSDVTVRKSMGRYSRSYVDDWYSLHAQSPRLYETLMSQSKFNRKKQE